MESYLEFDKQYKNITTKYADSNAIVPQMDLPPNVFNISCIPWMHFEHFSSNSKTQENQITKMITFGKYEEINSKLMMPITMQISHAIADGYHVSMFFENLQDEMNQKIVIISTGIVRLIGTWFYHRDKKYPLTKGYYLINKFSV